MGLAPILEVGMICVHCNDVRGSCQEWSPIAQGLDDCEKFQIVNVVVSFRFNEGCRIVSDRMSFVVISSLQEDGSHCESQRIHF